MPAFSRILILIAVISLAAIHINCMGAAPDKTAMKFIYKCQEGEWAAAESLLSASGKLLYKDNALEEKLWPMLGMAFKCGIPVETIEAKLDTAIILISTDTSTSRGDVRVKINNSFIVGDGPGSKIKGQFGLDSIDIQLNIHIVQENNRWKVERITPQISDNEERIWEQLAAKSPQSLGIIQE